MGSSLWIPPGDVLHELFRGPVDEVGAIHNAIVWQDRLPRACAALLTGAVLGITGSGFQAQFRNPLAEPYVTGVASGAAAGAVGGLLLHLTGPYVTVGFGFVGGLTALGLVFALSRHRGTLDVTNLLLSGVVVGSLLSALMSLGLLLSGANAVAVLQWLLGSFYNATWPQIGIVAVALAIGSTILVRQTRRMNAIALGEETAKRLGVDVARVRTIVLVTGTAMTAAVVGAFGIVGFVGLVAPHLARRLLGVDWRRSLPAAGFLGAFLMVTADLVAMRGLNFLKDTAGLEAPVGVVTAILGAPWLLALLRKEVQTRI